MPTNFQFSDEVGNGWNEELTANRHLREDLDPTDQEAANFMIDSLECGDHDPQMNDNTIYETSTHGHVYSLPISDDQGLEDWIIYSSSNFNM